MPSVTVIKEVKDSCTITVNEDDLTKYKADKCLESPKQFVPCSSGLQWSVCCYPKSFTPSLVYGNTISVYVVFTNDAIGAVSLIVNGTDIKNIRPHFRDGKVTITCDVRVEVAVPMSMLTHRMFQSCEDVPTDVELVVGDNVMKVHKQLLAFIAPGLYAGFNHDTVEARSGRVVITDFDFDIVKSAMDYFYGRKLDDISIDTIIGMLRFADKYNAKSADLEKVPFSNMTVASFCIIAHYAYDCCKDFLLVQCGKFFRNHQNQLKTTDQFAELPPAVIVRILELAFSLKGSFEVLCYAHKNKMPKVIEHFEKPMFESLSLTNFSETTKYAWDYSRKELKTKCAEFFYENRTELTVMSDFVKLKDVAIGVMQLSLNLQAK
uniref:BTB domain-containing protein n=1 Tax=Panagrellus redivivus TaxID=6233 RepID=A0A7E4ZR29_PANRE